MAHWPATGTGVSRRHRDDNGNPDTERQPRHNSDAGDGDRSRGACGQIGTRRDPTRESQPFTAPRTWTISYIYDCGGYGGHFTVAVLSDTQQFSPSINGVTRARAA